MTKKRIAGHSYCIGAFPILFDGYGDLASEFHRTGRNGQLVHYPTASTTVMQVDSPNAHFIVKESCV